MSESGNGLLGELVGKVAAVTSARELRECWEMTGAGGMLSEEITHPETGERMPFQDYFTERGAKLALGSRQEVRMSKEQALENFAQLSEDDRASFLRMMARELTSDERETLTAPRIFAYGSGKGRPAEDHECTHDDPSEWQALIRCSCDKEIIQRGTWPEVEYVPFTRKDGSKSDSKTKRVYKNVRYTLGDADDIAAWLAAQDDWTEIRDAVTRMAE
jgi:hypothetical protein